MTERTASSPTMGRMVVQSVVWFIVLGLLLFLPSGRWDWWQAWTFLAVMASTNLAIGFWLARHDPALLKERMVTVGIAEVRPWDRLYMTVLLIGMHGWFGFMGWEGRRPSPWPVWVNLLGGAGIALCMFIAWRTLRVNSFAAATVKVQADRAQTVISTGPYALVRHPMYAGALFWMFGMPLLIGTPWDLLGAAAVTGVIAVRALGEEKLLAADLPGYSDYMRKVRFRFIPGVW